MKIDIEYIKKTYNQDIIVNSYKDALKKGIKNSISSVEYRLINKYSNKYDKILDLGCGVGRIAFALENYGYKNIIGIDIANKMIQEAKRVNNNIEKNIQFEVMDATNLKFEENHFDIVLAFHSITPIPKRSNRKRVLEEVYRILKKNEKMIISCFEQDKSRDNFWEKENQKWEKKLEDKRLNEIGDIIHQKNGIDIFIHIPNRKNLINLIESIGFKVEAEYSWDDFTEKGEEINKMQMCKYWVFKK